MRPEPPKMNTFSSITHVIFLCVFYCASLCLLRLSWAEDVAPGDQADVGTQQQPWSRDNFSSTTNFSEGLIISVNSVITNSDITNSAVVQSSFEEAPTDDVGPFDQAEFAFVDTASQNSGVFNEITDTGQGGVVFTLADAATSELQNRADAATSHNETPPNLVNATNEQNVRNLSHVESQREEAEAGSDDGDGDDDDDGDKLVDVKEEVKEENKSETREDIPSFSEWTQKQLEEAERKKELVNSSSQTVHVNGKSNSNAKVRSKNYASPDCGAKIVSANPEAVSANAVLSPSRDEYKLNACTNRIWFVVELCEAIQAKKIDLANFELFSSSPKDFSVSVSDRFPTRDWMNVGQFTARDERDVQSFDLHPHLFGKFIKVEMQSHHGSEHFCPISLFRAYGTSEFEVLEKEDRRDLPDDDDDDDDDVEDGGEAADAPKNLISSATDAVISIVKKAAEVLGNKANHSENQGGAVSVESAVLKDAAKCVTPSHLIVCDNCSDTMFGDVYNVISCRTAQLYNLIRLEMIKDALCDADTCKEFGLDFRKRRRISGGVYAAYVKSFFTRTYVVALCNALAVIEQKVVLNISKQFPNITKDVAPKEIFDAPPNYDGQQRLQSGEAEKLTLEKIEVAVPIPDEVKNTSDASEIKPTKTFVSGDDLNTHPSPPETVDEAAAAIADVSGAEHQEAEGTAQEVDVDLDLGGLENLTVEYEVTTESSEDLDLMSELNTLGSTSLPNTASIAVPQAKESVFLRLSNRIKALERNMSLSSQYLEELSRRYKRQVEEMQRLLDKTVNSLSEESRMRDEHNRRIERQLGELSAIVSALMMEKNNWISTTYWFFLAVVAFFGIVTFCRRGEPKRPLGGGGDQQPASAKIQRRKSIAVVSHSLPLKKKERRPSEEALKIRGTYKDLMIDDVDACKKKYRERKRRKKKTTPLRPFPLAEEGVVLPPPPPPWDVTENRNEDDVPVVLEESDNSPLQSLPTPINQEGDSPPPFMKTLKETRSKRNGSVVKLNGYEPTNLDDDASGGVRRSPTPSSGGTSPDEVRAPPKKEKKGGIKRIFRKVF